MNFGELNSRFEQRAASSRQKFRQVPGCFYGCTAPGSECPPLDYLYPRKRMGSAISAGMPRKVVPPNSEFPYHISVRCINREWFAIPMDEVWAIMEDYLFFIHHAYEIEIISFVLMSNHFHMIVRSPKANLSEAMNYFMRETSKQIATRSGRINQIYGGRFHRTLIKDPHYFNATYKYVYRNPLEAGLCRAAHEYPYSTLFGKMGKRPLHFPIAYDNTLFYSYDETLRWLNEAPLSEDTEQIVKALKKLVFKFSADQLTGKFPGLSTRRY